MNSNCNPMMLTCPPSYSFRPGVCFSQYYVQPRTLTNPQYNYCPTFYSALIPTVVIDYDGHPETLLHKSYKSPHQSASPTGLPSSYGQYFNINTSMKVDDDIEVIEHKLDHSEVSNTVLRVSENWADLEVKEDPSIYEEEESKKAIVKDDLLNCDGQREWIDWTELNVKENKDHNVEKTTNEDCITIADETVENDTTNNECIITVELKKDNVKKVVNEDCIIIENNMSNPTESTNIRKQPERHKFKCDYCAFETEWMGILSKHLIYNHKDIRQEPEENQSGENSRKKETGNEKFQCKECSYKTDWKNNLTKHIISKHTTSEEIKWFECAHCPYKGKTRDYLRIHLAGVHSMFKHQWYSCTQCSFQAKKKNILTKHIISHHTDEKDVKWHKCSNCAYKTRVNANLRKHVQYHHVDEDKIKWYKCEHCHFKSKIAKNLRRHISNMHTDDDKIKWFSCTSCNSKYKSKAVLKGHMTQVHVNSISREEVATEMPVYVRTQLCFRGVPANCLKNKNSYNRLCKCSHCQNMS